MQKACFQVSLLCVQIFQRLVVLLGSDSNVVHTYAAVAVERMLAQKVTAAL